MGEQPPVVPTNQAAPPPGEAAAIQAGQAAAAGVPAVEQTLVLPPLAEAGGPQLDPRRQRAAEFIKDRLSNMYWSTVARVTNAAAGAAEKVASGAKIMGEHKLATGVAAGVGLAAGVAAEKLVPGSSAHVVGAMGGGSGHTARTTAESLQPGGGGHSSAIRETAFTTRSGQSKAETAAKVTKHAGEHGWRPSESGEGRTRLLEAGRAELESLRLPHGYTATVGPDKVLTVHLPEGKGHLNIRIPDRFIAKHGIRNINAVNRYVLRDIRRHGDLITTTGSKASHIQEARFAAKQLPRRVNYTPGGLGLYWERDVGVGIIAPAVVTGAIVARRVLRRRAYNPVRQEEHAREHRNEVRDRNRAIGFGRGALINPNSDSADLTLREMRDPLFLAELAADGQGGTGSTHAKAMIRTYIAAVERITDDYGPLAAQKHFTDSGIDVSGLRFTATKVGPTYVHKRFVYPAMDVSGNSAPGVGTPEANRRLVALARVLHERYHNLPLREDFLANPAVLTALEDLQRTTSPSSDGAYVPLRNANLPPTDPRYHPLSPRNLNKLRWIASYNVNTILDQLAEGNPGHEDDVIQALGLGGNLHYQGIGSRRSRTTSTEYPPTGPWVNIHRYSRDPGVGTNVDLAAQLLQMRGAH